ncbi:hypothetical protein J6590_075393 [Homalodisca vitripennis]|nr:hypothetical protein J6590_075393 [Homalodisca vitripennis]
MRNTYLKILVDDKNLAVTDFPASRTAGIVSSHLSDLGTPLSPLDGPYQVISAVSVTPYTCMWNNADYQDKACWFSPDRTTRLEALLCA